MRAREADAELARSFCGVSGCGSFSKILDRLRRWILRARSTTPLCLRSRSRMGNKESTRPAIIVLAAPNRKLLNETRLAIRQDPCPKPELGSYRFLRVLQ